MNCAIVRTVKWGNGENEMLCYKCFGNGWMFFKRVVYLECRVWKRQLYCSVRNLSKLSQHCSSNVSYISNSYNFCGDAVIYYSHLLRAWLCHKAASCKKIVLEKWQPVLLKTWSDKQKGTEDIAGGKVV